MVDFFGHQERARRQTGRLVAYFAIGVGLTVCLVYLALAAILLRGRGSRSGGIEWLWNSELFLWASAGTLAIVALGSLFKIIELSRGGRAVAEMLGGRLLDQGARRPEERKILNVVEEMAIASGVPVPDVYLLDQEAGINAFAAGTNIHNAVIGVTRGCVEQLDRNELQGVMAHEFSHILNGDMRLNLRLTGWVHGLLCIAIIGRVLLESSRFSRSSGRDGKGNNPLPIIGLALLVVGGIGMLFAKLIKAAVSRQREFLADASAVQFTRNPEGIAGALRKIGGLRSKLDSPKAEEASHLFFGNGLAESFLGMFSTHPPLAERIRRIDPHFKGAFIQSRAPTSDVEAQLVSHLAGGEPVPPRRPPVPPAIPAHRVMEQIGTLDREHLDYAGDLLAELPPAITAAVHEPFDSVALSYSLLLSPEAGTRRRQMEILQTNEHLTIVMEVERLQAAVAQLPARARIPLIEMALPALRQLSAAQFDTFRRTISALSAADRQVDLFEFALEKILLRHLAPAFSATTRAEVQFHSLTPLLPDCNVLLSALAYLSHDETPEVRRAYAAGVTVLAAKQPLNQLPLAECSLTAVDGALNRLARAAPGVKRRLVNACVTTVTADGVVASGEGELLRAICATVDVPCPPLL